MSAQDKNEYLRFLDTVRAVAQRGLSYADDPFDLERYKTLADAVAHVYGRCTGLSPAEIGQRFAGEVGYPTAKVGADAAIFRDGALLLIKRADTRRLALPGGWVDPGETPEETAVREVLEETGLTVEAGEIIGVFSEAASWEGSPHSAVHVLVRCNAAAGEPRPTPEAVEAAFRNPETVSDWHRDHGAWAAAAIRWAEHCDGQDGAAG